MRVEDKTPATFWAVEEPSSTRVPPPAWAHVLTGNVPAYVMRLTRNRLTLVESLVLSNHIVDIVDNVFLAISREEASIWQAF